MKKIHLLFFVFTAVLNTSLTYSQNVGVNFNSAAPNASAALDIDVSALAGAKKGLLIPRVTAAERSAMNPLPVAAQGLIVYQIDGTQGFYYNSSSTTIPQWTMLVENQSLRWDLLQNPQANLSLAHADKTTDFTFNGVTATPAFSMSSNSISSGTVLNLASSSNSGAPGLTTKVLNILRTGANTNSNHLTAGVYSTVVNTGTSSANYAGYFLATGGTINHSVHAETNANNGVAIHATNNSPGNGEQIGIHAIKAGNNASASGFAVAGVAGGIADKNYGGYFTASGATTNYALASAISSDSGYALYSVNNSTRTGAQHAVYGAKSGNIIGNGVGYAIRGAASGTASVNYGGYFTAEGATGSNIGVNAEVTGPMATAVIGQNNSSAGNYQVGIKGLKLGNLVSGTGIGVWGIAYNSASINTGGYFIADEASSNYGVHAKTSSGQSFGVYGENNSGDALYNTGVYGEKTGSMSGGTGVGIFGRAYGTASLNVGGEFMAGGATNNFAIWVPENGGKVVIGTDIVATNSMLAIKDGHIETQQTAAPIIAINANAGAGASATVATFSSDVAGAVTITTGSSAWAAGAQATIAFNKVYGNLPRVVIVATNANAAGKNYWVTSNISSFTINFTTAAASAVQHTFNYIVMEN